VLCDAHQCYMYGSNQDGILEDILRKKAQLASNFTNIYQITSSLSMLSSSMTLTLLIFMISIRMAFEKI
jgi:uncharacterized protein YoxC